MSHICNLPTRVTFSPSDVLWRIEPDSLSPEKLLFFEYPDQTNFLIPKSLETPRPSALDPWKLRERFLRLDRSEADLLDFLNDTGRWELSSGPYRMCNFWSWQAAINDLLLHPSHHWQETISEHLNPDVGSQGLAAYVDLAFEFSGGSTWFELTPTACLGALLATVLIDRSEGLRFKVCQRPDCRNTYRLESRHKRKYCTYECAHLESVRSSRRRSSRRRSRRKRK